MKVLRIHPETPQQRLLDQALEHLRQGGLLAYPTDTCYGLGCSIFAKKSIDEIYRIRGIKDNKPLSFVCSDLKDIAEYALVSNKAYRYMRRLVPGPYTFILPATRLVPKLLQNKRKQVGIRVPNHKIVLELVRQLGHPIISTSCKVAGEPIACADIYEIKDQLGHVLEMAIDGDYLYPSISTVVSIEDDNIEILREGEGDVSVFLETSEAPI